MKYINKNVYKYNGNYKYDIEFSLMDGGTKKIYTIPIKKFNILLANSTGNIKKDMIKIRNDNVLLVTESKKVCDYIEKNNEKRKFNIKIKIINSDELTKQELYIGVLYWLYQRIDQLEELERKKKLEELKKQKEYERIKKQKLEELRKLERKKKLEEFKKQEELERIEKQKQEELERIEKQKQEKLRKQNELIKQKVLEDAIINNNEIMEIINNYILMNKKDFELSNFDFNIYYKEYDLLFKLINEYISVDSRELGIKVISKLIYEKSIKMYANFFRDSNQKFIKETNSCCEKKVIEKFFEYCSNNLSNIYTQFTLWSYLIDSNIIEFENFEKFKIKFNNSYKEYKEELKFQRFKNKIKNFTKDNFRNYYSIEDTDLLTGIEFESFVSKIFDKMGYRVMITKGSGDQGIDIIAEKEYKKIGIQTKCYSKHVTNKAIQEVVAGLSFYNCDKGVVVTNSYFTQSAMELGKVNNIILWNRDILKQKIEEVLNV